MILKSKFIYFYFSSNSYMKFESSLIVGDLFTKTKQKFENF